MYVCVYTHINIHIYTHLHLEGALQIPSKLYVVSSPCHTCIPMYQLAFTRYCNAHYCMLYGVKTGGRKGVEYCAIAMQ